jgi:hypothetical protein
VTGRVALATCAELPALDEDEQLVLEPLRARGIEAEPAVWDAEAVDWSAYDLTVVRSAWDYAARRDRFLAWAESVPRLLNGPDVLRWNTDKRYLAELEAAGLPVVPTRFAEPGEEVPAPGGDFVVKPAVSAGARDTRRFRAGEDPAELVEAIHSSGRTAMVQPYLAEVDEQGETGVVFIGGAFSHAFRKGPLLAHRAAPVEGLFAAEHISAREPSPGELELAEAVCDWAQQRFGDLLYARVDIVPPGLVLELEVTEPSLFLAQGEGAAERFAAAIGSYAKKKTRPSTT